ncbi:MAG: glycoside hydrolase family 28 protein [Rhodobacteraceae bacterium]|jgi:polygalacturonase|nr:glycoside hydrolase family 28 protein [Paracoccaceae bacterium]
MTDLPTRRLAPSPDATAAIQDAIDRAPVRVVLEPGRHVSAGIRLRSDVELHLEAGAELWFRPDYDAYADTRVLVTAEDSDRAMITARGAERVALTGRGRITGNGVAGFAVGEDAAMGVRIPAALRPRLLVLDGCRDVTVGDLTITDSAMWTLHFIDCEGVRLSGLHIDNDRRMPNTDGIVIDACRDVTIEGCTIRTADDAVVLKTSARDDGGRPGACARVRVAHCLLESRSCALKIGTESHGPFHDIVFEDCRIENSNRALGIFSRDGGTIERVRFSRIRVDCHETPDGFWGSGEALTITMLDRRPERPAGVVRDIVVEDITGVMQGAIALVSERPGGIAGVRLARLTLRQEPGPLGTGQRYDIRPTPADLDPSVEAAGRRNAWRLGADGRVIGLIDYPGGMPGLFASGVAGLDLSGLRFDRPALLPVGWNPALVDY